MKSLKIGKLIINKKAILLIAVCVFFNGLAIGMVASYGKISTILLLVLTLTLYALLHKQIGQNVEEVS